MSVSENSTFSVKSRRKGPSVALLHPKHHLSLAGLLGLSPPYQIVNRPVRGIGIPVVHFSVGSWLEGAVSEVVLFLLSCISIDIHLLVEVLAPVYISN